MKLAISTSSYQPLELTNILIYCDVWNYIFWLSFIYLTISKGELLQYVLDILVSFYVKRLCISGSVEYSYIYILSVILSIV